MENTIQDYENTVKRPGKFQGEKRYMPYFWDLYLNGDGEYIDDESIEFTITAEDIALFPELQGQKKLVMCSTGNGFIYEG